MVNSKCEGQFCFEIVIKKKKVKVTRVEVHGDIWCHLFVTKRQVQKEIDKKLLEFLNWNDKRRPCPPGCYCHPYRYGVWDIKLPDKLKIHRYHLWDSGFLRGNCRLSFEADLELEAQGILGTCQEPQKPDETALAKLFETVDNLGQEHRVNSLLLTV